jgi:polar amino acid transport system substrate-binding protein
MNRHSIFAMAALLVSVTIVQAQQKSLDPRVADLVQSGKIRVALFLPQYAKDSKTGEIRGIGSGIFSLEVGRALATRLEVPMQVVEQPTPPAAIECLKAGRCDVLLLGIVPSRLNQVDFSPSVFQFDYTYLVPPGSSIQRIADADRPGNRIAIVKSHASAQPLNGLVKQAELVGSELPDDAFDLLRTGKADAFALPREQLIDYSTKLSGSRVLEDAYGINYVGMALGKGQPGRLAYISEFVEEAKTSGLIQRIIEKGGLRGFQVSPPVSASTR